MLSSNGILPHIRCASYHIYEVDHSFLIQLSRCHEINSDTFDWPLPLCASHANGRRHIRQTINKSLGEFLAVISGPHSNLVINIWLWRWTRRRNWRRPLRMSKRHRARPHQMNSTFLRHSTFQPFQLIVLVDCNFRPVSHGQLARPPVGAALHQSLSQSTFRFCCCHVPAIFEVRRVSKAVCRFEFALLCFAPLCSASLCFTLLLQRKLCRHESLPSGWCSPSGKRARIRGQLQCPAVILTE